MRGHIASFDGLRGLAILLVLMIHLLGAAGATPRTAADSCLQKIAWSGWCGVNLFFVLSGFLITGILFDTKDTARRARNFYARRTLRIWPLYYGVLVLWFVILPWIAPKSTATVHSPSQQQLWAWFYAVNWGCIRDGLNFWVPLHFWSLAVEEHFYLAWPLVIWGCRRRSTAMWACVACILLSTVVREVLVAASYQPYIIWMLDTSHFDALALGGLIALAARGPGGSFRLVRPARVVAAISAIALGAVIYLVGAMDHMSPRFLALGITPVVAFFGAALILVAHSPRTGPVGILFNSASMQFFGKYSYGIYVWHGLLMSYFEFWFPTQGFLGVYGSYIPAVLLHAALSSVTSVAAAVLSYHLFEKHFMKLKSYFEYRSSATVLSGPHLLPKPSPAVGPGIPSAPGTSGRSAAS